MAWFCRSAFFVSAMMVLDSSAVVACNKRPFNGPKSEVKQSRSSGPCRLGTYVRNWGQYPAIFERQGFAGTIFVISDLHGHFTEMQNLLRQAGVVDGSASNPKWLAGKNVLIVNGDMINKGQDSLAIIDFLEKLQKSAADVAGQVVILLGNHEVAFLDDPFSSKLDYFVSEIDRAGLDVCDDIYSPESWRGGWLRRASAAAIVNGIFIAHSGYTYEKDRLGIDDHFREMVDQEKWSEKFACGDQKQGFFNAQDWWGGNGEVFDDQLRLLDVRQIVFGHDPGAFGARGRAAAYFGNATTGRALVKIDAGLGNEDSRGVLLKCDSWLANGACKEFFVLQDEKKFVPLRIESGPPSRTNPEKPNGEC